MYSNKPHIASDKTQQEIAASLEGLNFFLDGFDTCFRLYIEQGDRACFRFCMQRLFVSMDTLYLVVLPELLATASQREASPQIHYQIWTGLRELKRLIEHIEPLCQLLNGLAMTMLEALDLLTDQSSDKTPVKKPEAPLQRAHTDVSCKNEHSDVSREDDHTDSLCKTALTECLNDWRQCHERCLSFAVQFAELSSLKPTLVHTDAALDALLEYACSLFGEVLPTFCTICTISTISTTPAVSVEHAQPRERIVPCLLDMMQKIDLVLVQTYILLDTLYAQLQYHALISTRYSQPGEKSLNDTIISINRKHREATSKLQQN